MYKIAVIGDKDSVLAFKILGVDVFITLGAQEARKTIDRIAKENYGIIFVTEQLAKDIPETIKRYNSEVIPAIILIPSNKGSLNIGLANIDKNVEKKDVAVVSQDVKGELTYEDKVIQKIIGLSLEKVPGLLDVDGGFFSNLTEKIINTDNVTHGVNVEVGKEQVAVDLNIVVEYQKNVPALYKEIKDVVVSQVTKMTDLEVVEVNVNVVDIKTKEQHEADSVSLQDRVTDVASSTGEFASEQFEKVKSGIGSGVAAVQEKVGEGVEAVKGETKENARVH